MIRFLIAGSNKRTKGVFYVENINVESKMGFYVDKIQKRYEGQNQKKLKNDVDVDMGMADPGRDRLGFVRLG